MDLDDLEPQHQPKPAFLPVNVAALSIEELQEYLAFLDSESTRAKAEIEAKKASISAADQVFKK